MRFHKGHDGWGRDSYQIPQYAVAGSSDCGMHSDSPAPSDRVEAELKRLQDHLEANGIESKADEFTQSGNCFMDKRWVVVSEADFERAVPLTLAWLEEHRRDTHYIHDADLEEIGVLQ